jgi:predicted small lipoprotein YifL
MKMGIDRPADTDRMGDEMMGFPRGLTERPAKRFIGLVIVLLAGLLLLAGCGRKGDPVPPIRKREPVKEQSKLRPAGAGQGLAAEVNSKPEIRISVS